MMNSDKKNEINFWFVEVVGLFFSFLPQACGTHFKFNKWRLLCFKII